MSSFTDERLCAIIGSVLPKSAGITPAMDLRADLGIDSVGLMSIVFVLEEQVGIDSFGHVQEFVAAESVADIIEIVRKAEAPV